MGSGHAINFWSLGGKSWRWQTQIGGEAPTKPAFAASKWLRSDAEMLRQIVPWEIIAKTIRFRQKSLEMELDAIVELGKSESTRNLIRNFFLAEK